MQPVATWLQFFRRQCSRCLPVLLLPATRRKSVATFIASGLGRSFAESDKPTLTADSPERSTAERDHVIGLPWKTGESTWNRLSLEGPRRNKRVIGTFNSSRPFNRSVARN